MRQLPKGIDPNSLPDLAYHRGHGIDRVTAWCLTPFCYHQKTLSFGERLRSSAEPGGPGQSLDSRAAEH
jgi:hypothetical protein